MNVGEELDRLAAEGRVTSVTLAGRNGQGWQCYLKMGLVDSYVAQAAPTPAGALEKAIAALPSLEAYDLKFSGQAVTARAQEAETKTEVPVAPTIWDKAAASLNAAWAGTSEFDRSIFD